MEKFTIKVTDNGIVVIGEKGNRMEFSAGEALMLLDILKNEEIIVEIEISMCLTVQNISTISAKHFLEARVELNLLRFFWEYALLLF